MTHLPLGSHSDAQDKGDLPPRVLARAIAHAAATAGERASRRASKPAKPAGHGGGQTARENVRREPIALLVVDLRSVEQRRAHPARQRQRPHAIGDGARQPEVADDQPPHALAIAGEQHVGRL